MRSCAARGSTIITHLAQACISIQPLAHAYSFQGVKWDIVGLKPADLPFNLNIYFPISTFIGAYSLNNSVGLELSYNFFNTTN
jgi:hypothetical protein